MFVDVASEVKRRLHQHLTESDILCFPHPAFAITVPNPRTFHDAHTLKGIQPAQVETREDEGGGACKQPGEQQNRIAVHKKHRAGDHKAQCESEHAGEACAKNNHIAVGKKIRFLHRKKGIAEVVRRR